MRKIRKFTWSFEPSLIFLYYCYLWNDFKEFYLEKYTKKDVIYANELSILLSVSVSYISSLKFCRRWQTSIIPWNDWN